MGTNEFLMDRTNLSASNTSCSKVSTWKSDMHFKLLYTDLRILCSPQIGPLPSQSCWGGRISEIRDKTSTT